MSQQRPPERERFEQRYEENGLASEMKQGARNVEEGARNMERRVEQRTGLSAVTQGYILMATGTVLLLYSLGFFPILSIVITVSSIAMIAFGAYRSDIFTSLTNSIEGMRNNRR